jgi:hypothetical protein
LRGIKPEANKEKANNQTNKQTKIKKEKKRKETLTVKHPPKQKAKTNPEIYRISGFFRVYPISALFATCSYSRRINQRKFDTKF